jgi:hypothetical protein
MDRFEMQQRRFAVGLGNLKPMLIQSILTRFERVSKGALDEPKWPQQSSVPHFRPL